jgi:hypothetical protein
MSFRAAVRRRSECPLSGAKRTTFAHSGLSAFGPKRHIDGQNCCDTQGNVDSGSQSLLPLGHTPTENSYQGSLGEESQSELERSRFVVLISKFRALCRCLRVPTPAAMAASHGAFATTPCDGPRIVAF